MNVGLMLRDNMPDPTTIDYGRPEPKPKVSSSFWVVLVLSILILYLMIEPLCSVRPAREKANQIRCASDLRQIGQAIYLYAADNAGAFPPDLQTVLSTQSISAQVFTCPSTSDTPANGPSALSQPGHCSYVYVGANLGTKADVSCVVAIEDPANHNLEGANILFPDGHVDWYSLPAVMQAFSDLAIGKNPPSATTSFTTSSAKADYEKNWRFRMAQLKLGVWAIPATQPTSKPDRVE